MGGERTIASWMRAPALHFLVIGALLFAIDHYRQVRSAGRTGDDPPRPIIAISARQIRQMQADYERKWRLRPTTAQLNGLIQQAVDDELLYREARRLKLDLQDRSVRLRLVQKMRAVSADPSQDEATLYRQALELGMDDDVVIRGILAHKMRLLLEEDPEPASISDADILEYVERHRDRFARPPTVTFTQVFLSATVRGKRLDEEARAVLTKLRSRSVQPEAAAGLSDPFPLSPELRAQSRGRVARFFGADFAQRIFEVEPKTWAGPLASPFGLHLVWVSEKTPEQMPPIDAVRRRAAYRIEEERAQTRFAGALQRLRSRYDIRIEGSDSAVARGTSVKGNQS